MPLLRSLAELGGRLLTINMALLKELDVRTASAAFVLGAKTKSGEAFAPNPYEMSANLSKTRRRFLAGATLTLAGATFGAFDPRRLLASNSPAPCCAPGPISPNFTL